MRIAAASVPAYILTYIHTYIHAYVLGKGGTRTSQPGSWKSSCRGCSSSAAAKSHYSSPDRHIGRVVILTASWQSNAQKLIESSPMKTSFCSTAVQKSFPSPRLTSRRRPQEEKTGPKCGIDVLRESSVKHRQSLNMRASAIMKLTFHGHDAPPTSARRLSNSSR